LKRVHLKNEMEITYDPFCLEKSLIEHKWINLYGSFFFKECRPIQIETNSASFFFEFELKSTLIVVFSLFDYLLNVVFFLIFI